jgi:rod shape-determining protein MreC
LRAQLARARLDGAVMEEQSRELERMQRMLGFRETSSFKLLSARVIAREASRPGSGYKIDRGARDGVREELAVLTPDGLVGKVVAVEPRSAWVRPLMARACKVSVRLERTRVDGILDWSPERGLHLTFVPLRAEAAVGDVVVTSGLGGVFPRGVKVGEVTAIEPAPSEGSLRLMVRPAVDFSGLEEVFVVLGGEGPSLDFPPPGEPPAEE